MNYKSIKEMPRVGFGLWKVPQDVCAKTVSKAIEIGYRHLDSASDYGNEKEVGEGIKAAIDQGFCQREDLWVTSKLWNTYHHPDHVRSALERTLEDLQLEYERVHAAAIITEKRGRNFDKVIGEWKAKVDDLSTEIEASQ